MDGLSSAASAFAVVSLAGQTLAGVKNLYNFWGSFQNAPECIQTINQDLQLLMIVVRGIQEGEKLHGPDPILTEVLRQCNQQLSSLTNITHKLERQLSCRSSSKRAWAALKTTFKQDKITKFQDMLRDTKVTLILAQSNHSSRVSNASFAQLLQHRSAVTITANQIEFGTSRSTLETGASQFELQTHASSFQNQFSQAMSVVQHPALGVGTQREMQNTLIHCPHSHVRPAETSEGDNIPAYPLWQRPPGTGRRRPGQASVCSNYWNNTVHNLFGTVHIYSEVRQKLASLQDDSEPLYEDDFIHTTALRVRPASWLMYLGLRCEFDIALEQSAQGWKHVLEAYRRVPNDALIFTACINGDLDLMRKLFANGEATVRDRDETGGSPLHYAAKCHQANVCKYLIDRGADKTTLDDKEYSPFYSLMSSKKVDSSSSACADTIRLFFDEIDFSEDAVYTGTDGWIASCTLGITCMDNTSIFDWFISCMAPEIKMCYKDLDDDKMGIWLHFFFLGGHLDSFYSKVIDKDGRMKRMLNHIIAATPNVIYRWVVLWPMIHISLSGWGKNQDSNVPTWLIAMDADPHLQYHPPLLERRFSPTIVATLTSRSFLLWRETLYAAGFEIKEFVRNECNLGSAEQHGWHEDSLLSLFQMCYINNVDAPRPIGWQWECPRCRSSQCADHGFGPYGGLAFVVDVDWCLQLERIKRDRSVQTASSEGVEISGEVLADQGGVFCSCVDKYEQVCLLCWEALRNPQHLHGDIRRQEEYPCAEVLVVENAPDGEDPLSDWEDSMFLLSI